MKTPPATPDDRDPLVAALRRDAARVQAPPFDSTLHHRTMRLVRAPAGSGRARWTWQWKPVLAGMAVLAVLALCISLSLSGPAHDSAHGAPLPHDFAAVLDSSRLAVAYCSTDMSSSMPGWMSPTASLLELPSRSSINPQDQP